jgi:hypothetical protein
MRNLKLSVIAFVLIFLGCSKDETQPTDDEQLQQLYAYAGVIVGSSGNYTIIVTKDGATATVIFDGQTHNLSIKKQIDKNNDIDSLVLTDGTVTLTYKYVYATMTPSITISIPGHTIDSTLGTLYDWRHPQIYIQFQEPIKLYEGEASSTMNTSFIKLTYNMSLDYPNKTFNLIEKCTGSSNLTDIGTVYTYNGAFTETSTELLLTIDSETLTLTKVGNDLKLSESGPDNYTNNIFFKKK